MTENVFKPINNASSVQPEYTAPPKIRTSRVYSVAQDITGTYTVYTKRSGVKAKLVYMNIFYVEEPEQYIAVDGGIIWYLYSSTTAYRGTGAPLMWDWENGIDINSALTVTTTVAAKRFVASFIIAEEPDY